MGIVEKIAVVGLCAIWSTALVGLGFSIGVRIGTDNGFNLGVHVTECDYMLKKQIDEENNKKCDE